MLRAARPLRWPCGGRAATGVRRGLRGFMGLLLLIILILLLLGALPRWDYSQNWGAGPSGLLALILIIVFILLLLGHIPAGFGVPMRCRLCGNMYDQSATRNSFCCDGCDNFYDLPKCGGGNGKLVSVAWSAAF